MAMKRWTFALLLLGIIFILASFVVYFFRIAACYQATPSVQSASEIARFQQDCGLKNPRVIQFSGFLVLFIPSIVLNTAYWLIRPPTSRVQREGPLASFLILTMFDSLLLAVLALLSYPEAGQGVGQPALIMAGFGLAAYVSLLGIWQWKRWGLFVFQGVTVLLTIYSGASGLTLLPAGVAIFSAIYLTLILRPLRRFMD